jgi:hypothetical protein
MCVCQKTPAEMNIKKCRRNGLSSQMRRRIHFIILLLLYTCLSIG